MFVCSSTLGYFKVRFWGGRQRTPRCFPPNIPLHLPVRAMSDQPWNMQGSMITAANPQIDEVGKVEKKALRLITVSIKFSGCNSQKGGLNIEQRETFASIPPTCLFFIVDCTLSNFSINQQRLMKN